MPLNNRKMRENRLDVQLTDQIFKLGLLNVNDFSLINYILLNANLKLMNINHHAIEHKFQIAEHTNFFLNVKVIC